MGTTGSVVSRRGTRDSFHIEVRARHADTTCRHIDAKGFFFLDRDGQNGRMVGFLSDGRAARQAELARAYAANQDRALQQEAVAHLGQQALRGAPRHRRNARPELTAKSFPSKVPDRPAACAP